MSTDSNGLIKGRICNKYIKKIIEVERLSMCDKRAQLVATAAATAIKAIEIEI